MLKPRTNQQVSRPESLSYVTVNSNVNNRLQCLTTEQRSTDFLGLSGRLSNGWTYFIRRPDGNIKIGSSASVTRRFGRHRRALGSIEILIAVPETVITEPAAHLRFWHLRVEGEIFRPAPELLAFIEALKGRDMTPFELQNLRSQLAKKRLLYKGNRPLTERINTLTAQIENYDAAERLENDEGRAALPPLRPLMEHNMAAIAEMEAAEQASKKTET